MLYPANLTEFIEEQMTLYKIENNKKNFSKIYKKCQRTLISLGFWDNAEVRLVGKSKTKYFSKEIVDKLRKDTADYFLKLSNFDKSKFDKIKKDNWTILFEDGNECREYDEEDLFYSLPVTQGELIAVMLTTLFEEKYTIDTATWAADKSFCNKIYKYENDAGAQTEFMNSDEFIIRSTRLKDTRNYVSKKQ